MRKWLKYILILAAIGIIAALLVFEFYINKPHPDYDKLKAEYTLSAEDLYNGYITDKSKSDNTYTGKIIQINGVVNSVEKSDTLATVVFVYDDGMFGDEGIRCSFLPKYYQDILGWNKGDKIILKGFCVGYNETDVILTKCSLPN